MKQELQTQPTWNPQVVMEDLQNTQKMCQALMQTPHYKRIGAEGIFAIVQKAKALKLNPMDALNGGMYCVNGKVEMSANMMALLIRKAEHSFTKDKRSDDTICILHGKRKDNGDTWTESFSIADAKRAGIYKNTWEKFPRNMLFARALSNIARQLFPDVIGGCYVEGEIPSSDDTSKATSWVTVKEQESIPNQVEISVDYDILTPEELKHLEEKLALHPDIKESLILWLKKNKKTDNLTHLPAEIYPKMMDRIANLEEEEKQKLQLSETVAFDPNQYGEQLQMSMEG